MDLKRRGLLNPEQPSWLTTGEAPVDGFSGEKLSHVPVLHSVAAVGYTVRYELI